MIYLVFWYFYLMIYFQETIQQKQYLHGNQQNQQYIRQSPSFASKQSRFKSSISDMLTPGPGQYSIPTKDIQRTSKYRIQRDPQNQLRNQDMWLLENRRFANQHANKFRHIGPGTYMPTAIQTVQTQKYSFPKTLRFKNRNTSTTAIVGPGSYNIELEKSNKNKNMLSSFKSQSQRFNNSLDSLKSLDKISNLKNSTTLKQPNKKSQLQRKIIQDNQILRNMEIDEYLKNVKQIKKYDNKVMPFFKSKIPRFKQDRMENIGPGYYNTLDLGVGNKNNNKEQLINQNPKMYYKNKIKKTYLQIKQENPQIIGKKQQFLRGPNTYNMKNHTIEHQIQKGKIGAYIDEQTRFHFNKKSKSTGLIQPGPGSYSQDKYVFVDKQEYRKKNFDLKNRHKIMQGIASVPFLTSQQRPINKQDKPAENFGYDNNYYDIETKNKKDSYNIAKLKMMKVNLPAFNTNAKRNI